MIHGNIDIIDPSSFSGWAIDSSSADAPMELKLVINKKTEVLFVANIFRQDVLRAVGSGSHGFHVSLTGKLQPGSNTFQLMTRDNRLVFPEKELVIGAVNSENMVEHGNDGWLFLKNDSNKTNEALNGTIKLSPTQLTKYERLFFVRDLLARHFRFKLVNLIVPDKNVVCNLHKINPLVISDSRPAAEIIGNLKNSNLSVRYPQAECLAEDFYFKTDTHPSYIGQRKLFDLILQELKVKPVYRMSTHRADVSGDLGSKLNPPITETTLKTEFKFHTVTIKDTAVEAFAQGARLTGTWTHHKGKTGIAKKIYVIGTSTAFYMREIFFSQFQDVLFSWHTSVDIDILRKYKPDYVVCIMTERFLTQVPDDNATKLNVF